MNIVYHLAKHLLWFGKNKVCVEVSWSQWDVSVEGVHRIRLISIFVINVFDADHDDIGDAFGEWENTPCLHGDMKKSMQFEILRYRQTQSSNCWEGYAVHVDGDMQKKLS